MNTWQDLIVLAIVGAAFCYLAYVAWGWWHLRRTCRCAAEDCRAQKASQRHLVDITPPPDRVARR